jgi:hypothetical protein
MKYLATPYTAWASHEEAFREACKLVARLAMEKEIIVYSPIVHTHPVAMHGGINHLDHEFWMKFDAPFVASSDCLIVAHMPGWDTSRGIAHEVAEFAKCGKPIYDLDIVTLTMTKRDGDASMVLDGAGSPPGNS